MNGSRAALSGGGDDAGANVQANRNMSRDSVALHVYGAVMSSSSEKFDDEAKATSLGCGVLSEHLCRMRQSDM